jgi:hypothetical protein
MKYDNLLEENKVTLLLLLFLVLLITLYPLLHVGFTTDDDTKTALYASMPNEQRIDIAINSAINQGRFFFIFSILVSYIPYLINSFLYYKVIAISCLIINIFLFGYLVRKFFASSYFALLSIVIFIATLQYSWEYNITAAYPFLFQFALGAFFTSIILFDCYLKSRKIGYGIFCAVTYFLSLCIYELFLLYFPLFILLYFLLEKMILGSKKNQLN